MSKKPGPLKDQTALPPHQRAAIAVKQLKNKSIELQDVTRGLEKELMRVEAILRPLGLVAAWCPIASGQDDRSGNWWSRELGYSAFGRDHRIALREKWGTLSDEEETTTWRFAEAPHWMQIESVNKLPDLFEELLDRVEQTTKKMNAKQSETSAFVSALSELLTADEA